jgi:nucleoside-diphosphate-sugar epimerase
MRHLDTSVLASQHIAVDLECDYEPSVVCGDIDSVIHLAGRAHILKEREADPAEKYRSANFQATLNLAEAAKVCGVRRFVLLSSVGVNGVLTANEAFDELSAPNPQSHYAASKYNAEGGLIRILSGSSMEYVIIRTPLVYDAAAPGNFRRLLRLVSSGMPLPFQSINNRRSMIALTNLVDFLNLSIDHPAAANQLFLISDGMDVSTPEIVRHIAEGMGRKARLFPVNRSFARRALATIGKSSLFIQLWCSLQIDSSKTRRLLGWSPELDTRQALISAGRLYRTKGRST